MRTKTGKTRLGPLNASQLDALLLKSTKPKEHAKIKRAISQRPALTPKSDATE